MYNTERTRPGFPCASNDGRNWLDPGDGTPILVDELWDYSQCNIAACAEAAPTLRLIPQHLAGSQSNRADLELRM